MNIDPQITAGIISTIVAAVLGWAAGWYSRSKKIVEWEVEAVSIIDSANKSRVNDLRLVIDKSVLTRDPEDLGSIENVDNAFVFFVDIHNAGNDIVEDITVNIELDSSATIVKCDSKPESSPKYILKPELNANRLSLAIPYLNQKGKEANVALEIISVGNKSESCNVTLQGKGVEQRERHVGKQNGTSGWLPGLFGAFIALAVVIGVTFVYSNSVSLALSNPQFPLIAFAPLVLLAGVILALWFIEERGR